MSIKCKDCKGYVNNMCETMGFLFGADFDHYQDTTNCNYFVPKDKDLEERVEMLEKRVEALEKLIP